MKSSISRRPGFGLRMCLLFFLLPVFGAVSAAEPGPALGKELREERYAGRWSRLMPHYGKFQYAGSMGMVSVGVGWDYGRRKQWETDFFLGYLPKFQGKRGHMTLTLKENYIPWRLDLGKSGRWLMEPFTVSMYVNKIFGDEFWVREPDRYPDSFYGFPTGLRLNMGFGQRARMNLKSGNRFESLTFFYEFTTCDLYVVSYVCNPKSLGLTDIFRLSLGIKFQFI